MKKQKKYLDNIQAKKQQEVVDLAYNNKGLANEPILFSRGKKINSFFTEDSKLYITPRQQKMIRAGVKLDCKTKKWDSLSSRIVNDFVRYNPSQSSLLFKSLQTRYEIMNEEVCEASRNFLGQFSAVRLWNASIVGSILFGMMMMTFVYRYLGQGASAEQILEPTTSQQQVTQKETLDVANTDSDAEYFARQVMEIEQIKSQQTLESEIQKMVKGYPIEKMVPLISKQDRIVAAFIIAIAKKESSWGQHAPVLNGQDCFNYWGYRGQRLLMGSGGHTCFNSPEDAVQTVAKRISTLVEEYGKSTPAEMVVWKCGNSCKATGGQDSANKWISDVTMYFDKLTGEE